MKDYIKNVFYIILNVYRVLSGLFVMALSVSLPVILGVIISLWFLLLFILSPIGIIIGGYMFVKALDL